MQNEATTPENAPDLGGQVDPLVIRLQPSTLRELRGIAEILRESAGNLRGLMGTEEAEALQVRELLPDELEGSALLLIGIANGSVDV